eukprot:TRINITY_DN15337_c0_g1_i1.p1 TRINITY_DN15337_c0_g1~~TRINITY_DN15337_c0_g1_i1.p1  ORF type:complete len:116 (-),score=32.71 TRINITY_DN15337_c0_g1_i1:145-492(-)
MFLTKIVRAVDHPYLDGVGGRRLNNSYKSLQGLTAKSLKHHVALQPLFLIMGVGMAFVAAYVGRLASKTTDVNWTKKPMEDQMGYYANRQFKWFNPGGHDYSKLGEKRNAPNYRE